MFVTVLLVAGSLALEREENAYARVTRGLVGPGGLLAEKIALGVVASFAVTLLLLAALTALVSIDWGRAPAILLAIVGGGAAFAAFGAAIGGSAKEVRASSLLAFMVSLPIAFLSLVPSGTVDPGVFHVIEVVRALFPFDPALDAMQGALDAAGPTCWRRWCTWPRSSLAYGVLARLALRRFASYGGFRVHLLRWRSGRRDQRTCRRSSCATVRDLEVERPRDSDPPRSSSRPRRWSVAATSPT